MRLSLTTTELEVHGHTVSVWMSPFSGLQIVRVDGREVSRRRSFWITSRHSFTLVEPDGASSSLEVAVRDLLWLRVRVARDGKPVAAAANWTAPLFGLSVLLLAFIFAILALRTLGDPVAAAKRYRRACDEGNAAGCNRLGNAYWRGRGVEKDWVKAAELYRKACDSGSAAGCDNLGLAYADGEGVAKDPSKAVELYRKACDGGSAAGCGRLGNAYSCGRGVKEDRAKAVELYRKACDRGHAWACLHLGRAFRHGNGVEKDLVKAAESFEKACKGGRARGCSALADAYAAGEGVERDLVKTADLRRTACDGGHVFSCFELGYMLAEGEGVTQDLEKAAALYRKACDAGQALGCSYLATAHEQGAGVEKDFGEAARLNQRVCDSDDPDGAPIGCYALALSYAAGKGVPKDPAKAAALHRRACEALGRAHASGAGVDRPPERAAELDQKACEGAAAIGRAARKEAIQQPGIADFHPDVILGRWRCAVINGGLMDIIRDPGGEGYQSKQVAPDSLTSAPGEITAEFRVQESAEHHYRGRHVWGGQKTGKTTWGRADGLVIKVLAADRFYVRYLDSRYSDGWIWVRAPPDPGDGENATLASE